MFPKRFVGKDVVELWRLLCWTVVCDDVALRFVEVCVGDDEVLTSGP